LADFFKKTFTGFNAEKRSTIKHATALIVM